MITEEHLLAAFRVAGVAVPWELDFEAGRIPCGVPDCVSNLQPDGEGVHGPVADCLRWSSEVVHPSPPDGYPCDKPGEHHAYVPAPDRTFLARFLAALNAEPQG